MLGHSRDFADRRTAAVLSVSGPATPVRTLAVRVVVVVPAVIRSARYARGAL